MNDYEPDADEVMWAMAVLLAVIAFYAASLSLF